MPPRASFRPVGRATPFVEATGGVLSALVFGLASGLRRARVFHPHGVAFSATLDISGADHGAPLLDEPGRHRAVVRLSRGVGLPERVPDILGLAVRVLDAHGPGAHQDLLLVTSGSAPVTRHALLPVRTFDHPRWSTVLPYRVGGRSLLFGAHPVRSAGEPTTTLEDVADELASGRLRYALDVAEPGGPWRQVGTVEVGGRLDPEEAEGLRFNPANTGGGIEPAGLLQSLRRLAYAGSQAGRPAP